MVFIQHLYASNVMLSDDILNYPHVDSDYKSRNKLLSDHGKL